MKIGVFGGTFDPIHLGHLIVADEAREMLELDEVLFIPAGRPWVKAGTPVTAACHRMAMVEMAVTPTPWFRAVGALSLVLKPAPSGFSIHQRVAASNLFGAGAGSNAMLSWPMLVDLPLLAWWLEAGTSGRIDSPSPPR